MFKEKFIKLCAERGVSPSYVCSKIGISTAAFSQWTDKTVPRNATIQRTAIYFDVPVDYLLSDEQSLVEEPKPQLYPLENNRVHMIPLFESVSAGFGALAVNDIVDYVPLYFVSSLEAAETICIKVHGDSMYPKIEDGDVIQVHKQDSVDSGSIAVVLLDSEEGLVKKVVYGETWIELHSMNPMYKTTRFNGPDVKRIRVVGLVKKIIKDV